MKPAKSPKVTIRDVATASGVHFSTVSRALDPARRKRISKEVLELVEATARHQRLLEPAADAFAAE